MKLVPAMALRGLISRPGRSFLAALGIAMGIATVVAVFTLDFNTILSLSAPGEKDWKAEIQVSVKGDTEKTLKGLRDLEGLSQITAMFQQDAYFRLPESKEDNLQVRLVALDVDGGEKLGVYELARGLDIDGRSTSNQILIGEALANRAALSTGDRILLGRPPRAAKKLCVDGKVEFIRDPKPLPPRFLEYEIKGILSPKLLGRRAKGFVVVVPYLSGKDLFRDVHLSEQVAVKKEEKTDIEKLKRSLGETFSYEINQNVIVGQAADERAFRNGLQFAGLMALVLGLYVIFHTISVALEERRKEIATLHALGCSRGRIAAIFFAEAVVLATLGGLGGLAMGLGICKGLIALGVSTLGTGREITTFEVPWELVGPLVIGGAVVALMGSVFPLLFFSKMSTTAALRGMTSADQETQSKGFRIFAAAFLAIILPSAYFLLVPTIGEENDALLSILRLCATVLAIMIGLPLLAPQFIAIFGRGITRLFKSIWPFASRLASASMRGRPMRMNAGVVAIALVCAAFVALRGMTASLSLETETWAQLALDRKVFLHLEKTKSLADIESCVANTEEVLAVETASIRHYAPFLILGMRSETGAKYGPLMNAELRRLFEEKQGLIITQRLAQDLEFETGDTILIRTGRGKDEEFPVLAIAESYGYAPSPGERIYAVASATTMNKAFCLNIDRGKDFTFRLKENVDPFEFANRLKILINSEFGQQKMIVKVGRDIHNYELRDIKKDFALFDIVLMMTAVLAGMGILNAQLLSALERQKEMGILRALAASPRQIAGAVLLEAIATGILGGLLGVSVGMIMTPIVVDSLQEISGLVLPHHSARGAAVLAIIAAVMLSVVATIYPIFRMVRANPSRAIRQA